ncbi:MULTISPECIES: type II toxin-antitoxin system antitoxin SocA domain-containing protein [unclassified Microbacterium]|uniref:Panacea domain-containing protein n=1 Tax=unclassified Microbacterium TaxID=2609290 RepID=UPI00288323FF|nr:MULTISPECIES: type II toxin-antitoxin system antitoxin SocA domain-containing protein [unclassified Microbacterium]
MGAVTEPATSAVADTVDAAPSGSIYDCAAYILQRFETPVSTMKLQKLLYLAQGWSLAITGRPLFDAEFEAWPSGPVNREIFELLKGEYTVDPESFAAKLQLLAASQSTMAPNA